MYVLYMYDHINLAALLQTYKNDNYRYSLHIIHLLSYVSKTKVTRSVLHQYSPQI